jgi:hypothetical protein
MGVQAMIGKLAARKGGSNPFRFQHPRFRNDGFKIEGVI